MFFPYVLIFLQVLAQDMIINDSKQWVFMSDRQKVSLLH